MSKFKLLPLLLLLITVALSSCDKDKDPEPTKTDFLTADTWQGFAIFFAGKDFTKEFKDEVNYDITKSTLKFEKNGNYTETYDTRSSTGKWEFANNEQTIILNKGTNDEFTLKVNKLDPEELYIEYTFEDDDGVEYTLEERYKHN